MSEYRYRWWGYVRRMIRDYPGLRNTLNDLRCQSITANMSGTHGGGGESRTVEAIATRTLPQDDQKAYDAVTRAIEITELRSGGKERIEMIRYIYWGRSTHKIKDAAIRCHVSVPTAKRWHGDFVRLVGKCYGFSLKDDTQEPKKSDMMLL